MSWVFFDIVRCLSIIMVSPHHKPMVSVLISAHNAQHFLLPTLQSVLDQSYQDIEVLILDDNSTDHTFWLREKISDSRVRWFTWDISRGPYGWLNFLLKKAQGKYIAIQDHDDLWHPDKLQKQITFLEKHNTYIGCGTTTKMLFTQDNTYFDYTFPKQWYYVIHPSLVFHNRPWLAYDTRELYMGDAYFMKKVLCQWEKRLGTIDEVLTTHIIQSNYSNASFSWFKLNRSCIQRLFIIHPFRYAILALGFEITRKLSYPLLKKCKKLHTILRWEQLPFKILGYKIKKI